MQSRSSRMSFVCVVAVIAAFASHVGAGTILAPDLHGYQTELHLTGGAGVGRNLDKWKLFEDGAAQSTNWSNQLIDFFVDLGEPAQSYMVGVTARNDTTLQLPDNYTQFKVGVSINDQFIDYLSIDASDVDWNTSWIDVGELSGQTKLTLNWVNDAYQADAYDANFAVGAVQFATAIPAPGTGLLAVLSIGLAAQTRHRK